MRTLGGNRADVLTRVVLPGILPGVFGGLSVGIGVAWICVISAEMISGRLGVGYRTWQAYTVLDYPDVFVGMITIGVLGFLTSGRRRTHRPPASPAGCPEARSMTAVSTPRAGMSLTLERRRAQLRRRSRSSTGSTSTSHRARSWS